MIAEIPDVGVSRPSSHEGVAGAFLDGYGQARFRGGVLGTIRTAPMGKGHGNDGRPFDVSTACYLKPVYARYDEARRNGTALELVLKAGVKTLKSFLGETCAGDHVCHASGDAAIFFATGETAEVGATTRILEYLKGIRHFQEKMATMTSRFDETNGAFKFPDKTLFILAANMSNTQQKNLAFVLLQDAFLTEGTGMIEEMIARTTQYKKEAIVILESQGGEKGYDFDRHYDGTDEGELHVLCPCCRQPHIFTWKAFDMERTETFEATLPAARIREIEKKWRAGNAECGTRSAEQVESTPHPGPLPDRGGEGDIKDALGRSEPPNSELTINPQTSTLNLPSPFAIEHRIGWEIIVAQEELTEMLRTPERRRCGFKRGPDELIKLPSGQYNEAAVLRETHYECFHCGSAWRDDGEFGRTRIALDESSHYVSARPEAVSTKAGFNIPQWINRRIPWGTIMWSKLDAQKVADELGNFQPLKIWWQKVAARTWNKEMTAKMPERIEASIYDTKPQPGEKVRISGTDIQFDLTWMVYHAWAIMGGSATSDQEGPRLLHREVITPPKDQTTDQEKREWCKNRVRALDKEFGIEVQNSMKDCAHRPDLVREWAAEDAVIKSVVRGYIRDTKVYTYGLLVGDERLSFKWKNPGRKPTWERFSQEYNWTLHEVTRDKKRFKVKVHTRQWSNFSIKEIAARWRDGNSAPKIQVHEKFLADTSKDGFDAQMRSEVKLPWKNRPGKERYDNQSRANHDWDIFCMVMVRMDELNYLNSFAAPQPEEPA